MPTYATITGPVLYPGTEEPMYARVSAHPQTFGEYLALDDSSTIGPVVTTTDRTDGDFELQIPLATEPVLWRIDVKPLTTKNSAQPFSVGTFEISSSGELRQLVPTEVTKVSSDVVFSITQARDQALASEAAAGTARAGAEAARAGAEAARSQATQIALGDADAALAAAIDDPESETGARLLATIATEATEVGGQVERTYQRRTLPRSNLAFKRGDYNRAPATQGAYNVIGFDTVNAMPYCRDDGNGVLRLCLTKDSLGRPLTWSNSKGVPVGTQWYNASKLLTFKGKLYLLTIQDSSGLPAIYMADPAPGSDPLSWSTPQTLGKTGSTARPSCFNADSTYMYFADYGDPTGGPDVRRSTDGTIWGTTVTFNTVRHVHAIVPDPYLPGDVWVAMGDGVAGPNRRSRNYGQTWAIAADANVQLTDLAFDEHDVYGVDDTAFVTAAVINKTTEAWAGISNGFHASIAVPAKVAQAYWDPPSVAAGSFATITLPLVGVVPGVPLVAGLRTTVPAGVQISATAGNDQAVVTLFNGTTGAVDLAGNLIVSSAGLTFALAVFYGALDPATGIFYMTTEQSVDFPLGGLFALMHKGATPVLLDYGNIGNTPVYINSGRVFYGPFNRPLLSLD